MTHVVDLYTIQVFCRDDATQIVPLESLMAETEENLNDLLPYGWYVRVRRWNDNPGDTDDR